MTENKSMEELAEKGRNLFNEEFTDETRTKAKIQILILLVISAVATAFDIGSLYLAYMKNPGVFIGSGISGDFASFMSVGDFPFILATANILVIFLLFFAYNLVRNNRIRYKSSVWPFTVMGIIFSLWHIYGGLICVQLIIG